MYEKLKYQYTPNLAGFKEHEERLGEFQRYEKFIFWQNFLCTFLSPLFQNSEQHLKNAKTTSQAQQNIGFTTSHNWSNSHSLSTKVTKHH